jgi:uncharacterized protein (TIRG00374 family)
MSSVRRGIDNGSPKAAGKLVRAAMLAVGAALLAYLVYRFGSTKVWLDLQSIGWGFATIVALETLVNVAHARAWWHTLPRQTRRGCLVQLFIVQLAGTAVNDTIPGAPLGGEPLKVLLLKERFAPSVTTASLLAVKVAMALSRVLFVVLGLVAASWSLDFDRLPMWSLGGGFLVVAAGVTVFMVLQWRGLSGPARRAGRRMRFLGSWVERVEHGLSRVDEHLHDLYRARPADFIVAVALGVFGLCLGVVQVWLLMGWIGLQRDWLSSLTIEAFSVLVGFVSFAIPGSLGAQEGGKLLIFAALGLPLSAGLSMGVAFRLNNIVNQVAGWTALAWLRPHRAVARLAALRDE